MVIRWVFQGLIVVVFVDVARLNYGQFELFSGFEIGLHCGKEGGYVHVAGAVTVDGDLWIVVVLTIFVCRF